MIRKDDQEAADQRRALDGNAWNVAHERQLAVDPALEHHRHHDGRRGRLHQRGDAAEVAAQENQWQQHLELRLPQSGERFAPVERRAHGPAQDARAHPPPGHEHDQQQSRQGAADEHLLDRLVRGDPVEDHRQARGQQQADRSRDRDQSDGRLLRVLRAHQDGKQQASHGEDRDARCSGQRREGGQQQRRRHRQPAGHPADERRQQPHQSSARAPLRQDVSGQREQRHGGQHRGRGQTVGLARNRGGGDPLAPEEQQRQSADRGEDRQTQQQAEDDQERRGQNQAQLVQVRQQTERRQDDQSQRRDRASLPVLRRVPCQSERDEREAQRKNAHRDPDRNTQRDVAARLPLDADQLDAGPEQG
jgi:hypothetical protein